MTFVTFHSIPLSTPQSLKGVSTHAGDVKGMSRLCINEGTINGDRKSRWREVDVGSGWRKQQLLSALDKGPEGLSLSVIPPYVLLPYLSGIGSPY